MKLFLSIIILFCGLSLFAQDTTQPIIPGAYRTSVYVPLLQGKRIGVFANQTSVIGNTNLIDTLLKLGVDITTIFSPEHGFRGNADAGASTINAVDSATHIPIISLDGKKNNPTANDLKNI